MNLKTLAEEIFQDAEPIVKGMGYELVDLRAVKNKTGAQVFAVIYRPQGVDHQACTDILKTLRPRIQTIAETSSIHFEVSSPGTERVFKSHREFQIFRGREVRILAKNSSDWLRGVIVETSEDGVELEIKEEKMFFPYADIKKAKLDYTQEGG